MVYASLQYRRNGIIQKESVAMKIKYQIIPGKSIGSLELGSNYEVFHDVVEKLYPGEQESRHSSHLIFPGLGLGCKFIPEDGILHVLYLYETKSPKALGAHFATPEGIRLGSSREDVIAAYGIPEYKGGGSLRNAGRAPEWFHYRSMGIEFDFNAGGKVEVIIIHSPGLDDMMLNGG
jgi:hypothetical protein